MFDMTLFNIRGHYKASYKMVKKADICPWLTESRRKNVWMKKLGSLKTEF